MALSKIDLDKAGVTGTLPTANLDTVGVAQGGTGITSGTTDQFLKFTGTTTLASAADNAGTLNKIASVDFESGTGANFVELQNCFNTTYDTYMFVIRRYLPEDNGDVFNFRLLTGTNTEVNSSKYYYAVRYYEDTGSVGGPASAAQNKFVISPGVHNGQEQGGLSGVIWMTLDKTDSSGNAFKWMGTHGGFNGNVDQLSQFGGGTFLDTSSNAPITGVKMFCDNQIRKIHMTCYGVTE